MRTSRAPCSRQIRSIASVCAVTPSIRPETSTSSTASASRGRPAPTKSSTACVARASIISIAAGTMPAAITADTAAAASSIAVKSASRVRISGGSGIRRTAMRVAMPMVPSLPTKTPRRSRPGVSGPSPPSTSTEPSGSTTSTASTWADVTPAARQCGPPALVPTLPPMLQACCDDGSGA